jgi:hypothetical protein
MHLSVYVQQLITLPRCIKPQENEFDISTRILKAYYYAENLKFFCNWVATKKIEFITRKERFKVLKSLRLIEPFGQVSVSVMGFPFSLSIYLLEYYYAR